MYSTKTIHKNINPNYPQGYTTIGDPYSGNNDKLPSRWKEKQFVTQKLPKNADNGLFGKLKYNSEQYIEMSERYSKTQPLADRKLGFGSRDASKTGEFTCWKTTERYRSAVKQERGLLEAHRDAGREAALRRRLPRGAPQAPRDRDGRSLDLPRFMYDVGRCTDAAAPYDPKSTRDCFYNLPTHAKGDIRRLGGHRPSSAAIGEYAWKHKYGRPEHGSSNGCKKFYDKGHLDVPGF